MSYKEKSSIRLSGRQAQPVAGMSENGQKKGVAGKPRPNHH